MIYDANVELDLQVGGTLNPRRHIYIERPEDGELFNLLLRGRYCNILSPRQMGKSSLMARTTFRLTEMRRRCVSIDLAGELGAPMDSHDWYIGILSKLARELRIDIEVESWWRETRAETNNQKMISFFRNCLLTAAGDPIIIFLDEIDSILRLPYTDDLLMAIRTMHNERSVIAPYEKLTFRLLGVATPSELIKDTRATAYNIGQTLELRDFDGERDDLTPLRRFITTDEQVGSIVLRRILYWTGGHPYPTAKICRHMAEGRAVEASGVDAFVDSTFNNLGGLSSDAHFQQILRFIESRTTDKQVTLALYEKIRYREIDRSTSAHVDLRLSGLCKRNHEGVLVVRNRLYERLFDLDWVRRTRPPEPAVEHDTDQKRLLRAYSISAALFALTVGLSVWGISLTRQLREVSSPQASISSIRFNTGAVRGVDTRETLRVPKSAASFFVILTLDQYVKSDSKFSLRVTDTPSGVIMWNAEGLTSDREGNLVLSFPRDFLPASLYEIDLYESTAEGEMELVGRYELPLEYY